MKQRGKPKSLKRSAHKQPERIIWLVFCEGQSEIRYFEAVKRTLPRSIQTHLSLEISKVVGLPKELIKKMRNHDSFSFADSKWIVSDVEWPKNHPGLHKVRNESIQEDITFLLSNPCFETWLIWHYQDQSRQLSSREAKRELLRSVGSAAENLSMSELMGARARAVLRAQAMRSTHERNGTNSPDDNPSSDIYLFIEALERVLNSTQH
jgi:hypothetical protein